MFAHGRLAGLLLLAVFATRGAAAAEPSKSAQSAPQSQPDQTAAIAEIKRLGGRFLAAGCKASWSPDGNRIVLGDSDGLKIIHLKTGEISCLVKPGKDPAWSLGKGEHIAYVAGEGSSQQVWLVEAAGGPARKLAAGGFPSWSADGKTLLLSSPAKSKLESKLQSIRIDVKDDRPADVFTAACEYAAISADGTRVAYRSRNELVVVDRKTGKAICTWPVACGAGGLPAWSPEGKRIAFGGEGVDGSGLWILNIENKQAVRVAAGPLGMPAWSADGSKLAFDLRLRSGCEVWTIETKNLEALPPLAMAVDRCTVPEHAVELIGPLHRPRGTLVYIDLGRAANRKLAEAAGSVAENHLQELAQGEQTFAGVRFRIGESVIQLGSKRLPKAPARVEGLPVERRVVTLYILHAAQWGDKRFGVADGTTIGEYRVRYADGSDAVIPIVCGEDVRDWWSYKPGMPVTRGQVVWLGRNPATKQPDLYLRLYLTAWENPNPERKVSSIDYLSTMTAAAPFCVAMTAEEPAPAAAPPVNGSSRRVPDPLAYSPRPTEP